MADRQFRCVIAFAFSCVASVMIAGCSGVAAIGTAAADANQKPPVVTYSSSRSFDRVFSAAVQTLTGMGQVLTSDKQSGVAQGKKGNWIVSATVAKSGAGATVAVSVRYVPSSQMDFNSREGLTSEFIAGLEKSLGQKLILDK